MIWYAIRYYKVQKMRRNIVRSRLQTLELISYPLSNFPLLYFASIVRFLPWDLAIYIA